MIFFPLLDFLSLSLSPSDSDVSCEYGSNKYYALCGFGGILSCGLTHTAVVPLDLIKCRIQVCVPTKPQNCISTYTILFTLMRH